MAADLLAFWFVTHVTLERKTGEGAYGPVFAPPADEPAWIEEGHRQVRTAEGREITSSARVFLPIDSERVPVGSRIALPEGYEPGNDEVVAVSRHHHPHPAMPSHWELALA